MWKAELGEWSSKMKKRPLSFFVSFLPLLQCSSFSLPFFSCTLQHSTTRKQKNSTSFVLWPWTELTGQLRFPFCHSVALKGSLAEELLSDGRLQQQDYCWQEPRKPEIFFFLFVCFFLLSRKVRGVTSVCSLSCSQFLRDTERKETRTQEPEVSHLTVDEQIWSQFHCGVKTCQPVVINSEDTL